MGEEYRRRFSFVDGFVAGIILFLLFLLAAPVLFHKPSQRLQLVNCSRNLMQLARANAAVATKFRGELHGYLEPLRIKIDAVTPDEVSATPSRELIVAWPAKLLPDLDEQVLYKQVLNGDKSFDVNALPRLDILVCPADSLLDLDSGALSYVVNSGMPDLANASDTQPSDLRANGICHDQRPGRFGPQVGLRDIKDGQNSTILLSENIHRDRPGSAQQPGNTWLRPAPQAENPEQWYGMVWVVDPQNPRSPRADLAERFNRDTRPESERDQPYAASGTRFARPASNHGNTFNVAFCGGSVKEIDENIDYVVYQQLMTPNGAKAALADAPDQPFEKTLPDNQRFMNPPITDADF